MKIKPHKDTIFYTLFLATMSLVCLVMFFVVGMRLMLIPYSIILGWVTISFWITFGRIIKMDQYSLSIEFLWYTKCYKWEELKVKQEIVYRNDPRFRSPYTRGIIFSARHVCKPKWLEPIKYNLYFHPFSFVFLNYSSENPLEYHINEEIESNLKKWGVEIKKCHKDGI